ncbi:MAG TPA: PIG-L family deacetylase [Nitrosopumilaceae archaeon]|nr:PIG-L family deacetylase [Nitrosopumilaceae archaeon]
MQFPKVVRFLYLLDVSRMDVMNVLAIGAHPDDLEIGCFATLAKHYLDGDKIFGAMVTNGELGGDVDIRREEQEATAKEIEMKLFFGNFPDGDVRDNAALVTFLDNIIKKYEIDVIYTHSENDRHQDHRAIARASLSAARTAGEVYCYEDLSLVSSFSPQLFVDVTETFHVKKSALSKFKSQSNRTFIDGLEGIAKFRASQCRLSGRLCEAFEIRRVFKNGHSPYHKEILDLKNQIQQYKNVISALTAENEIYKSKMYAVNAGLPTDDSVDRNRLILSQENYAMPLKDQNGQKHENNSKKTKRYRDELSEIKNAITRYKNEVAMLREELSVYKKTPDASTLRKNR